MDNTPFEEEVEVVSSLLDEVSEFGCTHEEKVDIASNMIAVVVLVTSNDVVGAVVASFSSNKCASIVDIPESRLIHSFSSRSLLVHASSLAFVI